MQLIPCHGLTGADSTKCCEVTAGLSHPLCGKSKPTHTQYPYLSVGSSHTDWMLHVRDLLSWFHASICVCVTRCCKCVTAGEDSCWLGLASLSCIWQCAFKEPFPYMIVDEKPLLFAGGFEVWEAKFLWQPRFPQKRIFSFFNLISHVI